MKRYYYIKCILDWIIAFKLMIVLSPILLVIGVLIKIDSKGPVIFKQERLGKKGEVFDIYKFRTMVDGAINIGSGLKTSAEDYRITRMGKILRKTSLDELPQIINVLKGEMSLIGPRPPVPYFPKKYCDYSDFEKKRFLLKPGITGYSQVEVRNSLPWEERIKYDIDYVEKFNFRLDVAIVLKTIKVVLKMRNVYK